MPCDQAGRPVKPCPVPVDPTPREIRQMCESIQAGWSESERQRRGAWMFAEAWKAPQLQFDDEMDAA